MIVSGILLINKPSGWSSFDVVAKIRGVISRELSNKTGEKRRIKVGHTGTLDPMAEGLMVVVVGDYCKKAQEFSKLDKTYEVTMVLGQGSSTGDYEGEITKGPEINPSKEEIENVLKSFLGESMQTPPIYSAIKINGHRAYKLARDGKEVKLEPRKITIYDIKLTDYSYPNLSFVVSVSSGTYIRSLGEDIAKKLGTLGYLTGLRRTKVGVFDINDAISIDSVDIDKILQY